MKTPLLWLPGLLNDARVFGHQVAALSNIADATVADLTGAHSIAALAQTALDTMPPGPFAMAGFSMGGYVALEILRLAPERVTALALLNSNARPDSAEATANRRRLMALAPRDFTTVLEALIAKQLHPLHLGDTRLTGLLRQMAQDVGVEGFLRQQEANIGRRDNRAHLANIRCPTVVIAGAEDAIMPREYLDELAQGIPGARLEVIASCGHISPLEQPEAVTAAVRAVLLPKD